MKLEDLNLREMLEFDPEQGKVVFGSDRMLIMRQDSFAVLRRLLFQQLGTKLARGIFAQFGQQCGQGDYETFSRVYDWETDMDRIGAGPVMHSWEGIVHAKPTLLEFDRETGHFHMTGEWRNSYEAEIHLSAFGVEDEPVCHTLTGYASGWASAFFGRELLAVEIQCVGKGDEICVFEIRPPDKWGPEAEPWKASLERTEYSVARELERRLETIERQAAAIQELSTPVLQVWEGVLVMPVIGVVDTKRSADIMERLLRTVTDQKAKFVILDITGVEVVDTRTADYIVRIVKAASLIGSRCILTGISPAVAQTLVEIGVDLGALLIEADLMAALKYSLKEMKKKK